MPFNKILHVANTHKIKFLKFSFVGSVTALIYFLVMWLAQDVFNIYYVHAVSLAYLISTTFHFFSNRYFTFQSHDAEYKKQLARYVGLWILNYLITIIVVRISVEKFKLSPYIGVCISVMCTVLIGYFLSHFWVFKSKRI
jgi:putative flippase GtrA